MNDVARVFVTGAGGFIGSHLCNLLEMKGVVFYRNESDLLDIDELSKSVKSVNFNTVVHLAGRFGNDLDDLYETNVKITQNLCNAMGSGKIKKIIFASTGAVYGAPQNGIESHETDTPHPDTLYGVAKLMTEHVLSIASKEANIPCITLRLPNVFGDGGKSIVNKLKQDIISHNAVSINGDGTKSRDFAHVDYVIDVIHKLLSLEQPHSEVYNLSYQDRLTINDVLVLFAKRYTFAKQTLSEDGTTKKLHMNSCKIKTLINCRQFQSIEGYINSN